MSREQTLQVRLLQEALTKVLNEIFCVGSTTRSAPKIFLPTSLFWEDLHANIRAQKFREGHTGKIHFFMKDDKHYSYTHHTCPIFPYMVDGTFVYLNLKPHLLWSLHIRTTYLSWPLNIRKKMAVCSVRSSEAKTNKPNGPTTPLTEEFFWVQSCWGSTDFVSINSIWSSKFGNLNETSISACDRKYQI